MACYYTEHEHINLNEFKDPNFTINKVSGNLCVRRVP